MALGRIQDDGQLPVFGWPDELLRIHFPRRQGAANNIAAPWYYYLRRQTPTYFQYIGSQLGGHGWQCENFLPVIRILPIDTQKMTPTTEVGFGSLEEAIRRTNAGEPISRDAWGRFRLKNPFFWKVNGVQPLKKVAYKNGLMVQPLHTGERPVKQLVEELVKGWQRKWTAGASVFEGATRGVAGGGTYTIVNSNGGFALQLPRGGIPIPELTKTNGTWYFGPIPPTSIFQRGNALIFKQTWPFYFEVSQLDPFDWNMGAWPPKSATGDIPGSAVTGNYGGYDPLPTNQPFPLAPPTIV